MGKFRPEYGTEQGRTGDNKQYKGQGRPASNPCRLQDRPEQCEGAGSQQGNDKDVTLGQAMPRQAF